MTNELIIAPSLLSCDFSRIGEECRDVLAAGADWIHYDVMDGVFVPNITVGVAPLASIKRSVDAFFDVHLMIKEPAKYVRAFAKAGANMITFHIESDGSPRETIELIRKSGAKVGITLRPGTPAKAIRDYIPLVDMVLVMTVEPGFGGQLFMDEMCEKIECIKRMALDEGREDLLIEADGGIAENTAKLVVDAGVNVLVAGSYIFESADRAKAIATLRRARKEN